jgi:hypothetical protein
MYDLAGNHFWSAKPSELFIVHPNLIGERQLVVIQELRHLSLFYVAG